MEVVGDNWKTTRSLGDKVPMPRTRQKRQELGEHSGRHRGIVGDKGDIVGDTARDKLGETVQDNRACPRQRRDKRKQVKGK